MKARRLSILEALILGCLLTISASIWFWRGGSPPANSLFIACPGAAFTIMLLLGAGKTLENLQRWVHRAPIRIAIAPALLWLLYLIYANGIGVATFTGAGIMALYLGAPFLFLGGRGGGNARWIEPAVVLWLWLPMEFGWIRRLLVSTQGFDAHYAFAQLLAIDAGILAFAVWQRTPNIGYRFEWNSKIARTAALHFLVFAVIAIPFAFQIGFIRLAFEASRLFVAPATFLGIFLFTAIPEEFLFRGLIQNWIERQTRKPAFSLLLAAIIFGTSHLNNGPPIPNYRYFLLALIAGVFYCRAWQRTGSLMCSAIVHALVDTSWSVFFR